MLVIETAGMFQRLNNHAFWRDSGDKEFKRCVLVSMGGVPTRACRRFVRRLSEEKNLPVFAFVDGDPYGYANIYRTLKVGSGNAAHVNRYFCVPDARLLGVTPEDIKKYELPTHPLTDTDIKRAKDTLKNDPFFQHHSRWRKAIKEMLKMGQRAEQQAFAKHSLNFVLETYLPEKLAKPDRFLP
jgi:DNA topoisomerase-6 subunit A